MHESVIVITLKSTGGVQQKSYFLDFFSCRQKYKNDVGWQVCHALFSFDCDCRCEISAISRWKFLCSSILAILSSVSVDSVRIVVCTFVTAFLFVLFCRVCCKNSALWASLGMLVFVLGFHCVYVCLWFKKLNWTACCESASWSDLVVCTKVLTFPDVYWLEYLLGVELS